MAIGTFLETVDK